MAAKKYAGILLLLLVVSMSSCGAEAKEEAVGDAGGTITVSAAASLTDAMNDIAEKFNEAHPHVQVDYNFGGSGALKQQIMQGAPADLFFSASEDDFKAVVDAGYIDETESIRLLANELVLVVPKGNEGIKSFDDLNNAEQIAVGNPESVPAGKYSAQMFESIDMPADIEESLIYTEDVRAVLNYVETGNVDAGVVYRTDAVTSDSVEIADTASEASHDPIIYPVGLLKEPDHPAAAEAFYHFLQTDDALEVFETYGFAVQ